MTESGEPTLKLDQVLADCIDGQPLSREAALALATEEDTATLAAAAATPR